MGGTPSFHPFPFALFPWKICASSFYHEKRGPPVGVESAKDFAVDLKVMMVMMGISPPQLEVCWWYFIPIHCCSIKPPLSKKPNRYWSYNQQLCYHQLFSSHETHINPHSPMVFLGVFHGFLWLNPHFPRVSQGLSYGFPGLSFHELWHHCRSQTSCPTTTPKCEKPPGVREWPAVQYRYFVKMGGWESSIHWK